MQETALRPLNRRWWAALCLLPAIAVALRGLGFFPSVMDWDESLYILQAREWLRGGWPLIAVWDMHPPGAPALFALAMAVLGESIGTIRLLGALAVAATGWGLFFLLRAAGAPPAIGYAAALLYAAHSVLLGGMPVNTEILFAPFVVWALALALPCALRPDPPPCWARLLGMGGLIGCAMLIKPVVLPEGCLAFLMLVGRALVQRRLPWLRLAGFAAAYALLAALPSLAFGLIYWAKGEARLFLESTVLAPLTYAQAGLPLSLGLWRVLSVALSLFWLVALAAAALWLRKGSLLPLWGLAWFAVATLGVMLPAQYFHHYFLMWLPSLALLAALGAGALAESLGTQRRAAFLALLIGAIALDAWRIDAAPRFWRGAEAFGPDTPARIAELIREEMPPGEPIFVANYQPIIYFLAEAAIPTRFPFPLHLTGRWARLGGIDMDAEIERVLALRPRFIVTDRGHWDQMRPQAARAITAALEEAYEIAYVFQDQRAAIELWRLRSPEPEGD
ncbi:MAG: glycosyltransferase family 39 protein [Rhodovarius sp.]|nr:glycosyltransferase family 39 protein [Rhodovarius sp.]MCX7933584.1 glycosyltransferase family 39 protein [Rhodovarius sp.]MDW8314003.1 glycosyltransferase family 39 protein [Rhodovarius sp.]